MQSNHKPLKLNKTQYELQNDDDVPMKVDVDYNTIKCKKFNSIP